MASVLLCTVPLVECALFEATGRTAELRLNSKSSESKAGDHPVPFHSYLLFSTHAVNKRDRGLRREAEDSLSESTARQAGAGPPGLSVTAWLTLDGFLNLFP